MSEKIDQIVEDLKTLTLLEASELVTKIEETFGVDASASSGVEWLWQLLRQLKKLKKKLNSI